MQKVKVAALLLTVASLTACADTKRVVEMLPTPPERLVCEAAGTRPTIPPEFVIDWSRVTTVAAAKAAHDQFVATVRTREGVVAGYVLAIEGKLAICGINAQWRRDFEAGIGR